MARLARIVVPGIPHHVTQRGNGRQQTFFDDEDYLFYRGLLGRECRAAEVEVWAWCLMPNHVHLILVPADPDGLRRALARVHRAPMPGEFTRGWNVAATSGRAVSARWRWMRRIWRQRCAMSCSIPCGPG